MILDQFFGWRPDCQQGLPSREGKAIAAGRRCMGFAFLASLLVTILARSALAFLAPAAVPQARLISTTRPLSASMQQGFAGADDDGMLWVFGCVE